MQWFIKESNGISGPFSSSKLKDLAEQKKIIPGTLVSQSADGPWLPASKLKNLFSPSSISDLGFKKDHRWISSSLEEISTANSSSAADPNSTSSNFSQKDKRPVGSILSSEDIKRGADLAGETIGLYRLFFTRVLRSDFKVIRATDQEIRQLTKVSPPITGPLAQIYACWRRSLLTISLLMLLLGLPSTALKMMSSLGSGTSLIVKAQSFLLFGCQLFAVLLCCLAAMSWYKIKQSKSFARYAWLIQIVGPLLIFMVPQNHLGAEKEELILFATLPSLVILPKILGVYQGLIRCSLTMKTLLPETYFSGWLAILISPLFAVLLFLATIIALQLSLLMLGLGLGLLAIGMLVTAFHWNGLLNPVDQNEASMTVSKIKGQQLIFTISGLAVILVYLVPKIPFELISPVNLVNFVFSYLANLTLLTVVMSDFMLSMIYKDSLRATDFAGTKKAESLRVKLTDLGNCGLASF